MPSHRRKGYRDLVGYYVGASYEAGTFTGSITNTFVDSLVDMNEAGVSQCALPLTNTTLGYGGICDLTASDAKITSWINAMISDGNFYSSPDPLSGPAGRSYLRIATGNSNRSYCTLYIVSSSAGVDASAMVTAGSGITKGVATLDISGCLNELQGQIGAQFLTKIYTLLTQTNLEPLITPSIPIFGGGIGSEYGAMRLSSSYSGAITGMMVTDKSDVPNIDSIVEGNTGDLIYYRHIRSGSADVSTTSAQAPGC